MALDKPIQSGFFSKLFEKCVTGKDYEQARDILVKYTTVYFGGGETSPNYRFLIDNTASAIGENFQHIAEEKLEMTNKVFQVKKVFETMNSYA